MYELECTHHVYRVQPLFLAEERQRRTDPERFLHAGRKPHARRISLCPLDVVDRHADGETGALAGFAFHLFLLEKRLEVNLNNIKVFDMRKSYDFSKSKKSPYTSKLKKQITIRLDEDTIDYFKNMSEELNIPYQNLINLYLRDCAGKSRKLNLRWAS